MTAMTGPACREIRQLLGVDDAPRNCQCENASAVLDR